MRVGESATMSVSTRVSMRRQRYREILPRRWSVILSLGAELAFPFLLRSVYSQQELSALSEGPNCREAWLDFSTVYI